MADNCIGVVDEGCLGWRTGGKISLHFLCFFSCFPPTLLSTLLSPSLYILLFTLSLTLSLSFSSVLLLFLLSCCRCLITYSLIVCISLCLFTRLMFLLLHSFQLGCCWCWFSFNFSYRMYSCIGRSRVIVEYCFSRQGIYFSLREPFDFSLITKIKWLIKLI